MAGDRDASRLDASRSGGIVRIVRRVVLGSVEQLSQGREELLLRRSGECEGLLVAAAVAVDTVASDVPHAAVSEAGHGDERVGAHPLRCELILDERLPRKVEDTRGADRQAAEHDGACSRAFDPRDVDRGLEPTRDVRGGIGEDAAAAFLREDVVAAHGESHPHALPADPRHRPALDGGCRAAHRVVQSLGERAPRGARAVVVLPHGDVAAAAAEVDLRHARLLLEPLARQAGDVVADPAVAVEALGMGRVVVQLSDRALTAEERDRSQPRVDEPFGCGRQLRVARAAHATADRAVGLLEPPAGGDPLDLRAAGPHVAERSEASDRDADGGGDAGRGIVQVLRRGDSPGVVLGELQALRIGVDGGSGMLVNAVCRHA